METQERKQFEQLKEKDIVNVKLPTGNITCTVVSIDERNRRIEVVDAEDKHHNVPENMITTKILKK